LAAMALTLQRERGWAEFTSGQMYYSLLSRDLEHDFVPFLRATGTGMTVWSPLVGGFLTGKYTRETPPQKEDRLVGFDFIPYDREAGFRLLDEMRIVCKAHGASHAQIALAWLLAKPYVTSVIIGASKMSQLEDNLKAIDVQLLEGELSKLDAMTAPHSLYPNWFNERTTDADHQKALGAAG
jgi:aryl-alcohol dehydrogenase-like predicted oxidoreductase